MRRLIYNIFFVVGILIFYPLCNLVSLCFWLFSGRCNFFPQKFSRLFFRTFLFFCGVRIKVSGIKNIDPGKPCIFVSNHQGIMDVPALIAAIPVNFRFLALKMLFKIPVLSSNMKMRGDIAIDRDNKDKAKGSLDKACSVIKSGESVHIFPEGIRTFDGSLGNFRSGAVVMARKAGAPVIPIAISGSYHILPRHSVMIKKGTIKLIIGKPVYFEKTDIIDNKTLWGDVEKLRNVIADMLRTEHAKSLG